MSSMEPRKFANNVLMIKHFFFYDNHQKYLTLLKIFKKYNELWANDESFVISKR